jgi:hypothetical protein
MTKASMIEFEGGSRPYRRLSSLFDKGCILRVEEPFFAQKKNAKDLKTY